MLDQVGRKDEGTVHTSSRVDKVGFHGEVLLIDSVLTGSVEVELFKGVGLVTSNQRTIDDDLNVGTQVFKLGARNRRDAEVEGGNRRIANALGGNVDGRLELALGAGTVGCSIQIIPVQWTTFTSVVPRRDRDGTIGSTSS